MDLRVVGLNLPGRTWGDPRPGGCTYRNIHVGVQRRAEVVDMVAADAARATWRLDVQVVDVDGTVDFRGPFVQGKRGDRFLYLSWGTVADDGRFEMFRRAKLMLGALDPETIAAAGRAGSALECRLGLTGADGGPRCAAVRPPAVEWVVVPA